MIINCRHHERQRHSQAQTPSPLGTLQGSLLGLSWCLAYMPESLSVHPAHSCRHQPFLNFTWATHQPTQPACLSALSVCRTSLFSLLYGQVFDVQDVLAEDTSTLQRLRRYVKQDLLIWIEDGSLTRTGARPQQPDSTDTVNITVSLTKDSFPHACFNAPQSVMQATTFGLC